MPFLPEDATVASIHAAFADGSLTAVALVEACLARIAAYDRAGPQLRSILALNPDALAIAARCDADFKARGGDVGPLHGIPVLLKDNFQTHDMPTTAGSVLLRDWRPRSDAFTVARMRRAGAIVLGKCNMQELARGGVSVSSLGGQVRNPYDLTRSAAGSSGGTGAALAAGFAVLGAGSDTGQSIRSPASANCLVGVRPTRGLVSRAGVMPNSFTQDEVGPLARTVEDAARLLEVMAGEDPDDPVTALGAGRPPARFCAMLRTDALQGARIGLLANFQGSEPRHAPVNQAMDQVVRTMESLGATVVRCRMPQLDDLTAHVSTDAYEAVAAFDRYLARLGADAPVSSLRAVADSRTAHPFIQAALEAELGLGDGMATPVYAERMRNRDHLRALVVAQMRERGLDALLYPMQRVLVAPLGQPDQPERNGVLSHGTGFPAVTFPAGMSMPTPDAPLGVPIGAELLAPDHTEGRLLAFAYAHEQAARLRRSPASTPPLR